MKLDMSLRLLTVAISLHLVSRIPFAVATGQCNSRRTDYDKALKGHTFDKVKVNRPADCVIRCENELRCQSFNYVMEGRTCELNNRSKEARPEDYVTDPSRIYMTIQFNRAPLGSISELPAESCEEIKASEGKEAVSGDYWLDQYSTGVATLFHCNMGTKVSAKSCSDLKKLDPKAINGYYVIDPDGEGGLPPLYDVICDMSDKNGVGVTVISHDSETRMLVEGCEPRGCYSRDIHYTGAGFSQLAGLTYVSTHCEQFIKYECLSSVIFFNNFAWWVSRDSSKMTYWGGADSGSGKCACGMNNSCADPSRACNCDKNDFVWREDSGLLTDQAHLPVKQLRFGDAGKDDEKGYHTLGKFKCYGIV